MFSLRGPTCATGNGDFRRPGHLALGEGARGSHRPPPVREDVPLMPTMQTPLRLQSRRSARYRDRLARLRLIRMIQVRRRFTRSFMSMGTFFSRRGPGGIFPRCMR